MLWVIGADSLLVMEQHFLSFLWDFIQNQDHVIYMESSCDTFTFSFKFSPAKPLRFLEVII